MSGGRRGMPQVSVSVRSDLVMSAGYQPVAFVQDRGPAKQVSASGATNLDGAAFG